MTEKTFFDQYVELPQRLDVPCRLPSREEERAYLERLLADIERKAALYAPLRGFARIAPARATDTMLGVWDDLALLRHVRRPVLAQAQADARDFDDIKASALCTRIEDKPSPGAAELWPADRWWERSGWEEAAVLLAGLYAQDCALAIRWLRDAQPEVAVQCIRDGA